MYTKIPAPLDKSVATNTANKLITLKSESRLELSFARIKCEALQRPDESVVVEIDRAVDKVVFFLSASNWAEVYQLALKKMKDMRQEPLVDVTAFKSLEVVALLFLDYERLFQLLTDYYTYAQAIKRQLHRLFIEYFIQHSMVYWIQSHPWEVVRTIKDQGPLKKVIRSLYEFVHQSSGENRGLTTWAFLTILSTLQPEIAAKYLASVANQNAVGTRNGGANHHRAGSASSASSTGTASSSGAGGTSSATSPSGNGQSRHSGLTRTGSNSRLGASGHAIKNALLPHQSSASSSSSQGSAFHQGNLRGVLAGPIIRRRRSKGVMLLESLDELQNSSERGLGVSSTCFTIITLTASTICGIEPTTPLVEMSRRLYNTLHEALFGSRRLPLFVRIDVLQSHFITSYAVLDFDRVLQDVIGNLRYKNYSARLKRNVIKGLSYLEHLPKGKEMLQRTMATYYDLFVSFVSETATALQQFEANSESSKVNSSQLSRDYGILVEACSVCLELIFTYSPLVFGRVPDSFAKAIVFCSTSKSESLRSTTTQLLFRFVRASVVKEGPREDSVMQQLASEELSKMNTRDFMEEALSPLSRPGSPVLGTPANLASSTQRVLIEPSHIVNAIADGVNMNVRQTVIEMLSETNGKELECQLNKVKTFLETRLLIHTYYRMGGDDDSEQVALGLRKTSLHKVLSNNSSEKPLSELLETALVLCLCSPHMEICRLAMENMQYFLREAMETGYMSNASIYGELISHSPFFTPMTIQRKMLRLFQTVDQPGKALVAVWKIAHERWDLINASMVNGRINDPDMEKQWKSYSGLMASLLIPLLNPTEVNVAIPDNIHIKARMFVKDMVQLLLSQDVFVRETSCEVLSNDTGPLAYHVVLKEVNELIDRKLSGTNTYSNILFTQVAIMVRFMVERLHQEEIYVSGELGLLTLNLVRFVSGQKSWTERTKMATLVCQLIEAIAKSMDTLDILQETQARTEIVTTLGYWLDAATGSVTSYFQNPAVTQKGSPMLVAITPSISGEMQSTQQSGSGSPGGNADMSDIRLVRDSSIAIARALKELMKGLAFCRGDKTHDPTSFNEQFDRFNRLFSLFTKLLNRVSDRQVFTDKTTILQTLVVEGISRLLLANVDIGLKAALDLGFSREPSVRVAFLNIFRSIVQETPAPEVEGRGYDDLVDFLNSDIPATLVLCDLCPSAQADDFSQALLKTFVSRKNDLNLVIAAIVREIEDSTGPAEILRRNCVATKLLTMYSKSHGQRYLQEVLGPFVEQVIENPDKYAFEVDIHKLRDKDYVALRDNADNFDRSLSDLIDRLSANIKLLPPAFRNICRSISDTVEHTFPSAKTSAVGSFFFLRYLCPVLVSPEAEGVTDQPVTKPVRRTFLLLAKAIQNIANGGAMDRRIFGQTFNSMEKYVDGVQSFLRGLCELEQKSALASRSRVTSQSLEGAREANSADSETDEGDADMARPQMSSYSSRSSVDSLASGSESSFLRAGGEEREVGEAEQRTQNNIRTETEEAEDLEQDSEPEKRQTGVVEMSSLILLHRYLYEHWEEAHHKLLSDFRRRRVKEKSKHFKADYFNESMERNRKFSSIVRSLGRPPSPKSAALPAFAMGAPTRLFEFMKRNENRDVSIVIERRVVQEGLSPDGTPVLVVTYANYNREEIDTELVLYRFFQVASKMWTSKFHVFYDCTGSKPSNQLSQRARLARDFMVPDQMAENLGTVYYCNVGTLLVSTIKNVARHYQASRYMNPANKAYMFLTTSNIEEHFNLDKLNLDPRSTTAIRDGLKAIKYNGVYRQHARAGMQRAVLRIGTEYVQIESDTKFEIMKGITGHANDVFHFSKISDAYVTSSLAAKSIEHPRARKKQQEEFIIEIIDGEKVVLSSRKRYEIVRMILNNRSKLGADKLNLESRKLGLKDAGAFLLNVGLVNLCTSDISDVQEAAFNLVCALPSRYGFEYEQEAIVGEGLGLPYNGVAIAEGFSATIANSRPDLTYDFVMSFAQGYAILPKEQLERAVVYLGPWMNNIGTLLLTPVAKVTQPVLADASKEVLSLLGSGSASQTKSEGGVTLAHKVVRKILEMTLTRKELYNEFVVNLWPTLCMKEELTETLLDEVVGYAVQNFDDLDQIIAVQTSFPTLALCGIVLSKCRALLSLPLPPYERSLVSHPHWLELVVLTRMLSSLSFESLTVAESYLPEIFQIITTFLYTGPYAFRLSLFKLLNNVLHSFVCNPKLPWQQKEHLRQVWTEINSVRGKLLFGLADEMRAMTYDYFVLASAPHVENCCTMLGDIARYAGTVQAANAWRSRWAALTVSACVTDNPPLQCRSFLVLGSLAKIEIEDNVVSRLIQVLSSVIQRVDASGLPSGSVIGPSDSTDGALIEEYGACIISCLTKMNESLSENSAYNGRLFWLAMALVNTSSVTLFTQGLLLMQAHLRILDSFGVFRTESMGSYLLARRRPFEHAWLDVEARSRARFTERYFHIAVVANIMKGLERSVTRSQTLTALETFLELCAKNEGVYGSPEYLEEQQSQMPETGEHDQSQEHVSHARQSSYDSNPANTSQISKGLPSYFCYLYFLYLGARSRADLKDFLWIAGYSEEGLENDRQIPSMIDEYIRSDSVESTLALFLGGVLFCTMREDDLAATRFLDSLQFVGEHDFEKKSMIYSIIRPQLLKLTEFGSQGPVIRSILSAGASMLINIDSFRRLPYYKHKLENLLTQAGFEGLLQYKKWVEDDCNKASRTLRDLVQAITIDPDT